ncbi:MAG TPA: sulfite exporter TauE/SafE family protein [Cyclobacteriaceae bacterium]
MFLIILFSYDLTLPDFALLLLAGLLVGMAKTGVHGAGMIAVPLLAAVFGGHASSGLLLPMLCLADIFAVLYYHRHASWRHLRLLFPWAAAGVVVGTIVGIYIDDALFKLIMAGIIMVSIPLMLWLEKGNKKEVPDYPWFGRVMGIAGGFTSMVGNLAGSVMALYLLSMRLPKNVYIGTTAWFFMVLNWFKVPFHVFSWHTITLNSFLLNLLMLPAIGLGAWLGVVIVRQISESVYRWFVIAMIIVAAVFMFI